MKKGIFLAVCLGFFLVVCAASTLAEDTLPPLGLPTGSDSATPTATITATATASSSLDEYLQGTTITPTASATSVQDAEDVADTGTQIYILAGVSLLAGFGLYSIKKYSDTKKYTL